MELSKKRGALQSIMANVAAAVKVGRNDNEF